MTSYKLTKLGEFVALYSVMVPGQTWRALYSQGKAFVDNEDDVGFYLDELLAGITDLRDRFYEILNEDDQDPLQP